MIEELLGNNVTLDITLNRSDTGLYPQVEIWEQDRSGLKTTLNLTHDADGTYSVVYSGFDVKGNWKIVFNVYTDSGHTVLSTVYEQTEDIVNIKDIDDFKADTSALATQASIDALEDKIDIIDDNVDSVLTLVGTIDGKCDLIITDIEEVNNNVLAISQGRDTTLGTGVQP